MKTLEDFKPYVKAITAFVVGALQVLALYVTLNKDGELSPEDLTAIINAIILGLTGTGLVYTLPNKK